MNKEEIENRIQEYIECEKYSPMYTACKIEVLVEYIVSLQDQIDRLKRDKQDKEIVFGDETFGNNSALCGKNIKHNIATNIKVPSTLDYLIHVDKTIGETK
jgi:prophage tail gpP-like protein